MDIRLYNLADHRMITFSDTYRGHFIDHQTAFTDLDPDFGLASFLPGWDAAILAALAVPTAETRDDLLQDRTQVVTETVVNIRRHVKKIKYFAQKAFATKPHLYGALGFDDYGDAYDNQARLKLFLTTMHKLADGDLKAPLLAQNCTQAQIDQILTLRDALRTTDFDQNVFRNNETVDTDARVGILNNAWSFVTKVRNAAEVVFDDDPVLLNLFLLPRRTERQEMFNVLGNISQAGSGNVLADVAVEVLGTGISTTTDEDGNFGLAEMAAGGYTLRLTRAGHHVMDVPFMITDPTTPTVVNAVMTPMP